MQCPYIVPKEDLLVGNEFNQIKEFECEDGSLYTYYYHWDGFDQRYNCQFCKFIGRKRDVFECLNESEWQECYAYKNHKM